MTKLMRGGDGRYHVGKNSYSILIGTRRQVWNGTAYKTEGNLRKKDLFQDSNSNLKSRKASRRARRNKNLQGFLQKKGSHTFGPLSSTRRSK